MTALSPRHVLPHLQANGLCPGFDVGTIARLGARAFKRTIETLTEDEVAELLWRYYADGVVVGCGANANAAREGVIFLKESHALEGEEETQARADIATVLAGLGVTLPAEDLEDLADEPALAGAIDRALIAAGRPERALLRFNKHGAIAAIFLRERLVPGPLSLLSP